MREFKRTSETNSNHTITTWNKITKHLLYGAVACAVALTFKSCVSVSCSIVLPCVSLGRVYVQHVVIGLNLSIGFPLAWLFPLIESLV